MAFLGIDIGGTGIKGAMVDTRSGELAGERVRIPTPSPSTPEAVADVALEIAKQLGAEGPAGITFPGVVKQGKVFSAAHLDAAWVGCNAQEMFEGRFGAPVCVLNDADAAGIAEIRFGAGRGRRGVVIVITLGTGIGSAIFVDGALVPNTEFGHLQIRGKDAERRASERTRETKHLSWQSWADAVAEFLEELDVLFSPDLFIVGGGVSKKADKFLPHLRNRVKVEIVAAAMKNTAGIVGAACMAPREGAGRITGGAEGAGRVLGHP